MQSRMLLTTTGFHMSATKLSNKAREDEAETFQGVAAFLSVPERFGSISLCRRPHAARSRRIVHGINLRGWPREQRNREQRTSSRYSPRHVVLRKAPHQEPVWTGIACSQPELILGYIKPSRLTSLPCCATLDNCLSWRVGIARNVAVVRSLTRLRGCVCERLLEVCDDVLNVLGTNRDTNEVLHNERLVCNNTKVSATLTSVTPLPIFSSSLSCSWVVVHG